MTQENCVHYSDNDVDGCLRHDKQLCANFRARYENREPYCWCNLTGQELIVGVHVRKKDIPRLKRLSFFSRNQKYVILPQI